MKIERMKYLLIALVILLTGCSELLTSPDEKQIADRPITTINFEIRREIEELHVLLYITNYNFELVRILLDEEINGGSHSIVWDGSDYNNDPVASGVYYYYLVTNGSTIMGQISLIK